MPSRLGVGLILLFWAATLGYVGYRDVWPRLFADAPPPVAIDLVDEATPQLPVKWGVYRGDQKVGALATKTEYVPADDTFRFTSTYTNLKLDTLGVTFSVPKLVTAVRVDRDGRLREQHMDGELKAALGPVDVGGAAAKVDARVEAGQLVGRVKLTGLGEPVDHPLEPVPVPDGQVLNPLMPVNRLRDVRPGQRWTIRAVDPLRDSLTVMLREVAKKSHVAAGSLPQRESRELIAEVRSAAEELDRKGYPKVWCWVIEYRGEEVQARTWVSRDDGRVLRQEATGFGEQLRFDRED
jgi:hypothetical protein